jgi:helicase MOV-10
MLFFTSYAGAESNWRVPGDRIFIQPAAANADKGRWFEGCVHFVQRSQVGLRFGSSFQGHTSATRYRVRFKLNRYPMRRQHQAMDTAFAPPRLLFPTVAHLSNSFTHTPSGSELPIFNKLIANNPPQLQAVSSILRLPAGSPPFAVFGP